MPLTALKKPELLMGDNILTHNRAVIRAFCDAIGKFRELSPTMPVGEVQMFLLVALHEGSSLTDLAEYADMKKSTASRYLLDLSDKTRSGAPGFALITRESDPGELRKNMYALTDKGKRILSSLVSGGTLSQAT